MRSIFKLGRFIFAFTLAAFGIQHILYAAFFTGVAAPWFPENRFAACAEGAPLLVAGLALLARGWQWWAAGLAAFETLLLFGLVHLPDLIVYPHRGDIRSSAFEILAMSGGALALVGLSRAPSRVPSTALLAGRFLFALSALVFGADHFIYPSYVAAVVPGWLPAHLFWAWFTGAAFIAAGIGMWVRATARLSTVMLGLMFLLWVAILHLPRVVRNPQDPREWTSAFVALAMCGVSWTLAEWEPQTEGTPVSRTATQSLPERVGEYHFKARVNE